MNIGKLLKEKRLASDLSIKEVSKITGISVRHLSYIENEERNPSLETLTVLCRLYKMENLPVS